MFSKENNDKDARKTAVTKYKQTRALWGLIIDLFFGEEATSYITSKI